MTTTDLNTGLSVEDVAVRERSGLRNDSEESSSRPVRSIIRANTVTRFNALLLAMFAAIAAVGAFKDSLFIWVVVLNSVVGIVQELRARRTLDALQLLTAPQARVRRSGRETTVSNAELVQDDLIMLTRGDRAHRNAPVLLIEFPHL